MMIQTAPLEEMKLGSILESLKPWLPSSAATPSCGSEDSEAKFFVNGRFDMKYLSKLVQQFAASVSHD